MAGGKWTSGIAEYSCIVSEWTVQPAKIQGGGREFALRKKSTGKNSTGEKIATLEIPNPIAIGDGADLALGSSTRLAATWP
mmetsp:Transcript_82891/g.146262  ORF Transcript_82891/g.146262 Transcript_82891/m.146262 type:complete len:81 (+) Transcript_82891:126-368(+)